MTNKIKVKDKLEDDTLDLSFCDLQEVPIREIAAIKKATRLDLSNNSLVSIPNTIVSLTSIIKLDLSKNMLTEIPENIGEMRQLRHLDLYSNQISRLPLSLGELKNLKWLDLKDNPLTAAVASVAGPCSNSSDCQACARNIVAYLSQVKQSIEEEKVRRKTAVAEVPVKKEAKKKKKKNVEKIVKVSPATEVIVADVKNGEVEHEIITAKESHRGFCSVITRVLLSTVLVTLFLGILFVALMIFLPKYDETLSDIITNYLEAQTKLPVKYYQELAIDKKNLIAEEIVIRSNKFIVIGANYYGKIVGYLSDKFNEYFK
ncbi:leucine-rich repeat-containing protein 59-like [Microplitis mediator]|uniref:leucine-rich repeat-containing protein 59-like n=1 Tax=Microplitis mediator TaxID=375433 RepID=UPI00255662EC|nr:leucine-rich repeat-containing protein 59-like [Microplitis mediator]